MIFQRCRDINLILSIYTSDLSNVPKSHVSVPTVIIGKQTWYRGKKPSGITLNCYISEICLATPERKLTLTLVLHIKLIHHGYMDMIYYIGLT